MAQPSRQNILLHFPSISKLISHTTEHDIFFVVASLSDLFIYLFLKLHKTVYWMCNLIFLNEFAKLGKFAKFC